MMSNEREYVYVHVYTRASWSVPLVLCVDLSVQSAPIVRVSEMGRYDFHMNFILQIPFHRNK